MTVMCLVRSTRNEIQKEHDSVLQVRDVPMDRNESRDLASMFEKKLGKCEMFLCTTETVYSVLPGDCL